eukprot:7154292-Prymnesium_polylepis.2
MRPCLACCVAACGGQRACRALPGSWPRACEAASTICLSCCLCTPSGVLSAAVASAVGGWRWRRLCPLGARAAPKGRASAGARGLRRAHWRRHILLALEKVCELARRHVLRVGKQQLQEVVEPEDTRFDHLGAHPAEELLGRHRRRAAERVAHCRPQLLPLLVSPEDLPLVSALLHCHHVDGERAASDDTRDEAVRARSRACGAGGTGALVVRVGRVEGAELGGVKLRHARGGGAAGARAWEERHSFRHA